MRSVYSVYGRRNTQVSGLFLGSTRGNGCKKKILDDDSEECEDDEECGAEYAADGADDDLGNGEVSDGSEVEVRDDEEDDNSAHGVDEEFKSVPEEEEENCRDCDGDNDHEYGSYHKWYSVGRGKRKNVVVDCCPDFRASRGKHRTHACGPEM